MSAPSGLLCVAVGLLFLAQGCAAAAAAGDYNFTLQDTVLQGEDVVDVAVLSPVFIGVATTRSFRVYNVSDPHAIVLVGAAPAYNATRLTISPDGRTAVIASSNGGVYTLDLQDFSNMFALFHVLPSAYDTAFQGGLLYIAQEQGVLGCILGTRFLTPVGNLSGIGPITRLGTGSGDVLWAGGRDGVYRLNVSIPTDLTVESHLLHRLRNYTEPLVFHDLDMTPDGEVACVSVAYPPSYPFDFKCIIYVDNSNPMGNYYHDGTLNCYNCVEIDSLAGGRKVFRTPTSGVVLYSAMYTSYYTGVFQILPASLGQPRLNIVGPGGRVAVSSSFNDVFIAAGAGGLHVLTNQLPVTPMPETLAPVTGTLTLAYSAAPPTTSAPPSREKEDPHDVFFWIAVALGVAVVGLSSGTAVFCWIRRGHDSAPRQEYSGVYNDAGDAGSKQNHELTAIMLVD